jgi:superfamily II DNA or RNA helicase
MNIEVDRLESRLITDDTKLLKALIDLYTFNVPNAFYSSAYKKGWNGKKSFISNNGKFKTGLLHSILSNLAKINVYPDLNYCYEVNDIQIPSKIELQNFNLRDYQVDLLRKALTNKRGIVFAPTSAGKTAIIAYLLQQFLDRSSLMLFNRTQLLVQTYEFLTKTIKLDNIGLAFGNGFIPAKHMLCTVQSLEKVLGTPAEYPDLLLVDEVHEFCTGKFTSKVITAFPTADYRFGFTGTLPEDDIKRHTLFGAFGPTLSSVTTQDLITSGFVAKPNIKILNIDYSNLNLQDLPLSSIESLDYQTLYSSAIVFNKYRNGLISKIVSTINHPNPKIVILTQSLEHAKILEELIPNSKKIEGSDSLEYRHKVIKWFKKENKTVLIGTNILQTGIDIKEITHFIVARALKSFVPTIQALGRALRKDKDDEVWVYDFYDRDKGILEKQSRSRIKAYKKEGHKVEII